MQQTQPDLQTILNDLQRNTRSLQMQIVRTKQLAAAALAELDLTREGRAPRFRIEFNSQYGEDVLVWELLGRQTQGFYIEAGAFDGYHCSVTLALEALGWTGLLVEPLPGPAGVCRGRRPASRVVHSALSRRNAPSSATFTVVEDRYGGMQSYLKPTDEQVVSTNWFKRHTITVPVTTLDALLAEHDGPVDLATIDVEGGELDVLDGFDLDRFKPRLLVLEDRSQGSDPALASYMSRFPYQLAFRHAFNAIFVRNDEAEVLLRAKWLVMG